MDSTLASGVPARRGRSVGLVASFAIGIVLARMFDPAVFGTYKQFFLIYATLYGVAQLGMAESLYYFVPRKPEHTGRYAAQRDRDARADGHRIHRRALRRAAHARGMAEPAACASTSCRSGCS